MHPGKKSKDKIDKLYKLDTARSKESNEDEGANLINQDGEDGAQDAV